MAAGDGTTKVTVLNATDGKVYQWVDKGLAERPADYTEQPLDLMWPLLFEAQR